jgi:hypothetical protein
MTGNRKIAQSLTLSAGMALAPIWTAFAGTMPTYSGEDAGFIVIGMGSYTSVGSRGISYTLTFRKKGASDVGSIDFTPHRRMLPFLGTKTDFDDPNETGFVEVRKLAPG